jgi:hypothetical protein
MAKELSEMLTDLSRQARKVEDGFSAIADETDAAAERRREKTRAAATAAASKLDQGVSAAGDSVAGHWRALQARMNDEIAGVQQGIADRRRQRDVSQAEQQAEAAKERAMRAIAFASAAMQTAEVAALDAAVARREADAIKQR